MNKDNIAVLLGDEVTEAKVWLKGFFEELTCKVDLEKELNFKLSPYTVFTLIDQLLFRHSEGEIVIVKVHRVMKHDPNDFWEYVEQYRQKKLPDILKNPFIFKMPF